MDGQSIIWLKLKYTFLVHIPLQLEEIKLMSRTTACVSNLGARKKKSPIGSVNTQYESISGQYGQ